MSSRPTKHAFSHSRAVVSRPPEEKPLFKALRSKLLGLSFDAYLFCIARLLKHLGYTRVALTGRRDWKGANGKQGPGGYDLVAYLPVGLGGERKVVVQAKQFDEKTRVYQRSVDELRGVALREGADEALLLTTGPISEAVDRAAAGPVRLLDGPTLLNVLISSQIGVAANGAVDTAFFSALEEQSQGNGRGSFPAVSEVLVTISLEPRRSRKRTARG